MLEFRKKITKSNIFVAAEIICRNIYIPLPHVIVELKLAFKVIKVIGMYMQVYKEDL